MPQKTSGAALPNPNIKILLQGKPLSIELATDFVSATVSEDLEAPSMFELKFYYLGSRKATIYLD